MQPDVHANFPLRMPKKEMNKVQGNMIKNITLTPFYKVFLKAFHITLELASEIAS